MWNRRQALSSHPSLSGSCTIARLEQIGDRQLPVTGYLCTALAVRQHEKDVVRGDRRRLADHCHCQRGRPSTSMLCRCCGREEALSREMEMGLYITAGQTVRKILDVPQDRSLSFDSCSSTGERGPNSAVTGAVDICLTIDRV
jgi:hypothetical protein